MTLDLSTLDPSTLDPSTSGLSTIDLSIVIVSWNTCDLLDACLQSVEQELTTMDARAEILVIDNASTDDSVAMLRACHPQVRLTVNAYNRGFAQANNQGLQLAQGRYSLLLNPDTLVLPGSLGSLLRFMDGHSQAGAAGARLLNADGSLQPSCAPAPTLSRELWRMFHLDWVMAYGVYTMKAWPLDAPRQVDIVQGAAMIVRRTAQDQVGLLDPGYFMYSEEVDWCTRIHDGGWSIYWVPASHIIHYGGQSSKQVADAMFVQLYRAKIQYFGKHKGQFNALAYKALLGLAALARLALTPFALLEPDSRRNRHLHLAHQYSLLLRSLPTL